MLTLNIQLTDEQVKQISQGIPNVTIDQKLIESVVAQLLTPEGIQQAKKAKDELIEARATEIFGTNYNNSAQTPRGYMYKQDYIKLLNNELCTLQETVLKAVTAELLPQLKDKIINDHVSSLFEVLKPVIAELLPQLIQESIEKLMISSFSFAVNTHTNSLQLSNNVEMMKNALKRAALLSESA